MNQFNYYKLLFFVFLLVFASNSFSQITDKTELDAKQVFQTQDNWSLVGEGEMSWLWFDIYRIKLFTPTGKYHPEQRNISLKLTYQREISKQELIEVTEEEWQRQKIEYQQDWLATLNDIWPDVNDGDSILFNVDELGNTRFYFNDDYIGSLNEQSFSSAFAAIWLSEDTLKPKLRNQLVGIEN